MTGAAFNTDKWRAEALDNFPYAIRKVAGRDALVEWERLRRQEGVYPVVVGSDEDLDALLEPFHPSYYAPGEDAPSTASVLEAAAGLRHPESLNAYLKEREAYLDEALKARRQQAEPADNDRSDDRPTLAEPPSDVLKGLAEAFGGEVTIITSESDLAAYTKNYDDEPAVGDWPGMPPDDTGLSVAYDVMTGKPLASVNIVLLPTDDGTEAPAYLRWGNWNDNPPPEHHVAALRSWRERYGAELVGLSFDVMNIRVANKPSTREEALDLAREHYDYCYDIVDQGSGTLSPLAASLKAHEWWYFWWD